MNVVYHLSYVLGLVLIIGETLKRGPGYFAINATTMLEDYVGGAVLLLAALFWHRRHKLASKLMAGAWAYSLGGLFVPFFAHLEAWLRGATFRPDQPHQDIASIVIKGVLWLICLACVFVTLRSNDRASAGQLRSKG
jgi:hypothetical protein